MAEENKKVILIVDDDNETREIYANLFRENDFVVLEAKDGIEGLDIATSRNDIDVIFTGIIMPRMDGFQFMKALKEYAHTTSIPVIINSHLGREEDRKTAMSLGAKDFIIRGLIPPREVVQKIIASIGSGEYFLNICPDKADAKNFFQEIVGLEGNLCPNCGSELLLKVIKKKENQLAATIVCQNCGKIF